MAGWVLLLHWFLPSLIFIFRYFIGPLDLEIFSVRWSNGWVGWLWTGKLPAYEDDDGPLSSLDFHVIQKAAALFLPKGCVVKKRSLL